MSLLNKLFERTSSNNTTQTACQLLALLKVPVSKTTAIESIEAHPNFPSLFSISDSLKKWRIENVAMRIEPANLDEVPVPFVAHLKKGSGYFFVVTKVDYNTVSYITENGKEKQKSREEFLKEWGNIALFAEVSDLSGEKEFAKQIKKEKISGLKMPFILLASIAFVLGYAITNANVPGWIYASLLLLIKLAGVLVTSLLLWFEIDKSNPVLKQVCGAGSSGGGRNTNCTAVLESKQAKLFGWLSWSEIGFVYFTGGFMLLLFNSNSFGLLAWLNLFALPYTAFSIFYQWKIAKQWCPLCLMVQGLLFCEFIITAIGHWQFAGLNFNNSIFIERLLLATFVSFLLPVFFWMFTKEFLLKSQRTDQLRKELNKFKYNPELFQSLLPKQKAVTVSPDGLGITLGNPNATNTIIKVCNPYCGPCAKAHPIMDEILESNDDVKVQIIFTATNDEADTKAKPVKHLMALYEKKDDNLIHQALGDWYNAEKKDYDAFANKYQLNGELQKQGSKIESMSSWCKETDISFTPTFFVNGYQLPEIYQAADLKHLL